MVSEVSEDNNSLALYLARLNLTLERFAHLRSYSNWIVYFFITGFFIYLFFQGAILAPDSGGYLGANLLRSPGYPLFIKLMSFIHKDYSETLLIGAQLLLGLWATLVMARTFQKFFNLPDGFFGLLTGVILTPYLGKTGNYVLTEGLAYPLFLFSVHYLLKGLIDKNNRSLSVFFIFISVLVLTRSQFWFMYVIALIGLVSSFQYNKKRLTRVILSILLVGSFSFSYGFDKIYHKIYHGVLTSTPFTGVHLFIQPLYVSNIEDAELFSDSREQHLFLDVRQEIEKQKMSNTFSAGFIDPPYHFYTHFNEILYKILYPALSRHGFQDAIEVDTQLKQMAIKLIANRPIASLKLYSRNVASILGGYYNSFIILLIFISSFFYYLRYRNNLCLCAFLVTLMMMGNGLIVASLQPFRVRYTFYVDVMLCCLFLVILYQGLKRGSHLWRT